MDVVTVDSRGVIDAMGLGGCLPCYGHHAIDEITAITQIVHDNDRGVGMVEAICQGSSGGFVGDTEVLEAGNPTSILGELSLSVIKVSGSGDDRMARIVVNIKQRVFTESNVADCFVEILLSGLSHFGQHHRRQLFSRLTNHKYALTLPYTRITY